MVENSSVVAKWSVKIGPSEDLDNVEFHLMPYDNQSGHSGDCLWKN